jgi:hypothetical protein
MAAIFKTLRGMNPGGKKLWLAVWVGTWLLTAPAQFQSLPPSSGTIVSAVVYYEPPHEQQMKVRLTGAEMTSLPNAMYDVKKMKIESFGENGMLEAIVEAPQCTYAQLDAVASSPGPLEIRSADGKALTRGNGFLWLQGESKLYISNNVQTVIKMRNSKPFNPLTK